MKDLSKGVHVEGLCLVELISLELLGDCRYVDCVVGTKVALGCHNWVRRKYVLFVSCGIGQLCYCRIRWLSQNR